MNNNGTEPRIVLVTGASSGIGRATSLALARSGATVVAGARRLDRLNDLAETAEGELYPVELDVTDRESVRRAIESVIDNFERLDVLVNNAGVMLNGMILGGDPDDWARMVDTNLLGSMYVVHAALPHLIAARGAIVQVSSTAGRTATLAGGAYAATKFGINAFAESLRQEVTTQGVRVTLIEPGFVSTELASHNADPAMRELAARYADSMRTLQPEDIAAAVVYALEQPDHVSVNELLIRPTDQVQ